MSYVNLNDAKNRRKKELNEKECYINRRPSFSRNTAFPNYYIKKRINISIIVYDINCEIMYSTTH